MDLNQMLDNLRGLDVDDLKNIGSTPAIVRILAIFLLCAAVIGAGIKLFIMPKYDEFTKAETREQKLRQEFVTVQGKAANLEAYREQLDEMRRSFGAMLRQLPDTTDIESLLIDLSQASVASGLEVDFFKPSGIQPKEFYAQFPIQLKVTGKYHEFGTFISAVAALPRIVTLQDISIVPTDKKPGSPLNMEMTAITYHYLTEGEESTAPAATKGGKK